MLTEDKQQMPDQKKKPLISAILAMDMNQLIGANGSLPWHLPADLQHFKKLTLQHPVIMGRETYLSIGKPLPQRINIIMTRNTDFEVPGCLVAHSPEEAILKAGAGDTDEIFIIGGAAIYSLFMPLIERLYITQISHVFSGDTYFTSWHPTDPNWQQIENSMHAPDEKNAYAYRFMVFERG
jgi:dihydrofolate reductase